MAKPRNAIAADVLHAPTCRHNMPSQFERVAADRLQTVIDGAFGRFVL
jgi:hypothetical protein